MGLVVSAREAKGLVVGVSIVCMADTRFLQFPLTLSSSLWVEKVNIKVIYYLYPKDFRWLWWLI